MPPVGQTVSILNSHHFYDLPRRFNLCRCHLAQPDMPDLALFLHLFQSAKAFFQRCSRIDPVQLVKIDAFQLQPSQAHLHTLYQIPGTPHILGLRRPLPRDSAFGGDHQSSGIRRQRLANQPLRNLWPVGVGGVDQRDAQFHGSQQYALGFGGVGWLAPCAIAHQPHGSIAEPMNVEIAANQEFAAGGRR